MAKADHDDTSSPYEWVSPREYVKRIAKDPAAETEAQYSVEERFRRGEIPYRYPAGNGTLRYDDLSDDFRRELVIDFATSTATRPGRTIREENPDYPSVSDPLRPKTPQWFGADPQSRSWNPFSRPEYIDREVPAETITGLQFLAPPVPAVEQAANPPDPPVRKLSGKEWVPVAFERRRKELLAVIITEAGRRLSKESGTALDCAKQLSVGYCINELRKLPVVWLKKPKSSP